MVTATITYRLNGNTMQKVNYIQEVVSMFPITAMRTVRETVNKIKQCNAYVIDLPKIKKKIKNGSYLKNANFAIVPIIGLASGTGGMEGVLWDTFMQHIFPLLTEVAKVFCVIKIAQGFYMEKRGGREDGSALGTFITYGKWLLLFHMVPFFVEFIDQFGHKMLENLRINPIDQPTLGQ